MFRKVNDKFRSYLYNEFGKEYADSLILMHYYGLIQEDLSPLLREFYSDKVWNHASVMDRTRFEK